jgi:hypothetical protein
MMGMESPDTRRKADDSYRAHRAGRSYFLPARVRERARHDWNTQFNDDRTLGYGIMLGRVSRRLPM